MANAKDLFDSKVTASVQQPPTGVNVTEVTSKDIGANVISQAESKEQQAVQAEASVEEVDSAYIFTVERAAHKVTVKPITGQVFNYFAECSCAWQGRFLTSDEAEIKAKRHVRILAP